MMELVLPELGEGIEKATIACWLHKEGDVVSEGEDVVELVTDKASFNVVSEIAGTMTKVFYQEGDEAKVGEPLAIIENLKK